MIPTLTLPFAIERLFSHGESCGGGTRNRGGMPLTTQIVTRALDDHDLVPAGDDFQGGLHFGDGTERIARAVHEQSWRYQARKMRGSQFEDSARRMQRVGKQQQPCRDS